jgi:hypothetical protein
MCIAASVLLLFVVACGEPQPKAETAREATVATQQYWVKRWPDADLSRFTVRLWDQGRSWRVIYTDDREPKRPAAVFEVEKKSGNITRADFVP